MPVDHYFADTGSFKLLDGDKISCLVSAHGQFNQKKLQFELSLFLDGCIHKGSVAVGWG